jgi:hypothetical protein
MLVGLVFYVYNLSDSVNRRVDLQSAADATAVTGATWMARSMNVIAMDNVAEARLICLACVLDSLPLAAEMTVAEEDNANGDSLTRGLGAQLQRGIPNTQIERFDFLRKGLDDLYRQMLATPSQQNTQMDALKQIDSAFNSVEERNPEPGAMSVEPVTHWNGGTGSIWQAIIALDELSQATAESAGVLAQADAQRFGKANRAEVAMVTPLLPRLPALRGSFNDYGPVLLDRVVEVNALTITPPQERHAVVRSNLVSNLQKANDFLVAAETARVAGGAIPDYAYPHRLGPWARLFSWRNPMYIGGGGQNVTRIGIPEYDIGSQGGGGGGIQIGYSTYGPMEWARRMVRAVTGMVGVQAGSVDSSRFEQHLMRIATVKLAFIFGVSSPQDIQYAQDWITDFNEAKAFATTPGNQNKILRTQYYRATVRSVRRWDDPRWLMVPVPKEFIGNIGHVFPPPPTVNAALWVWPAGRAVNGWHDIEIDLQQRCNPCPRVLKWRQYPIPGQFDPVTGAQLMTKPLPAWQLVFAEWERVLDYVWRIRMQFEMDEDWDLNEPGTDTPLTLRQNADGSPIYWTTYSVGWYVFRGSEVRNPVTVYTPGNWGGEPLPAPMLLDTSWGDYDPGQWDAIGNFSSLPDADAGYRREMFTYLGVARRNLSANHWPQKFSPTVKGLSTALAQAKVFNNRSWDLWTQDWQVQLMPAGGFDDWRQRVATGQADLAQLKNTLDDRDVQSLLDFLTNMPSGGMDAYVKH